MIFGHLPEILLLLFLALLVFGPKRMIEMGSSVGRMFRELREATRDINWSNMLGDHDERPRQTPFSQSTRSDLFRATTDRAASDGAQADATDGPTVVEGSIEQPKEPGAE